MTHAIMNQSADYWHYGIGVNVIQANTKLKETYENWTKYQDQPIPDQLHEVRKQNGYYSNGLAIIPGKIWRGSYVGKYLVAIDLDNKKAIEEFCKDGLDDLKQQTLVEQTSNPDKMHIYFIVDREIPNKASDKVDISKAEKIKVNEIPALEVKSNSKGIMFCSYSPHKNGSNYKIIGTLTPKVFNAHDVEDRIRGICDKYGIPYGFSSSNNNSSYQTPIEDLWKTETKILKGHNRHLELLRIMESLLQNNRKMPIEMIKQMAYFWNQNHCLPPLDDIEMKKQWKCATNFIGKNIVHTGDTGANPEKLIGDDDDVEKWKNQLLADQEKYLLNGKAKKKQDQQQLDKNSTITSEKEKYEILIQKLRGENSNLTSEEWSIKLLEKRTLLNEKVNEHFPAMQLLLDFELSIKTILNIQDITLPFMGIVFAVPSSLKTQFFELLRKLWYSYFTDKFTARSFVSHSANVAKDKLSEIDMLPMIKDKILLTPELSPLFTGKDDNIKEEFGIITRVLDGKGLETNSGVHGKRGYYGTYMFTWLGAAVDIPYSVYKFLSTIGFKIYFLRLPRTKVTADELVEQLTSKNKFSEKMEEIEKLLMDYLTWFEVCPIAIGQNKTVKIEWDSDKDYRDTIKIIAELALLLAHIRGSVYVYKSSEHEELIPIKNNLNEPTTSIINNKVPSTVYSEGFGHSVPIIENPSRANQQLYNLARGHALSYGRNYITKDDILLIIKVVLSTGSIERVLVLDLLIANNGTLTTSQIKKSMNISNDTAKRTMTEFEGLELVTMERVENSSNSEHKIRLNPEFNWFLGKEFAELRDKSAASKNTPVRLREEQEQEDSSVRNNNNNNYSHRGGNPRSKNIAEDPSEIKAIRFSSKGQVYFESEKEDE